MDKGYWASIKIRILSFNEIQDKDIFSNNVQVKP